MGSREAVFRRATGEGPHPAGGGNGLVLVVEDDPHIAALVQTYLVREGFRAEVAADGEQGLALAQRLAPALVILDLMLPRLDGCAVCRELRACSDVPVLMLTARGEELDRLLGFALGADDYVVKPFSPRELVERVKAILRRLRPATRNMPLPLRHGPLALDAPAHQATLDGEPLALTPSEFRLLEALMNRPGQVLTREALLGHIKTLGEIVVDRVVDVHVGKLRRKIEPDPANPRFIETVRGLGYRLRADACHPDRA